MEYKENNNRYLLIKGANGMGNRILGLFEGILYAKLTNRKIIIDWRDEIYSDNKENSFFSFFKKSFCDSVEEIEGKTVFPEIWKGNLDKSIYEMFRKEGVENNLDGWQKFSVDIENIGYQEDVLVFISFGFGKLISKYNFSIFGWPNNKVDLIKFFIKKYVFLNEDILKEINLFKKNNFKKKTIGVHIRYTDNLNPKFIDYKGTNLNLYFPIIDNLLLENKDCHLFIATDNREILKIFISKYKNVIFYSKFFDKNNKPIHYSSEYQKREIGKEALIDLYLLASCDYLIYSQNSTYGQLAEFISEKDRSNIFNIKDKEILDLNFKKIIDSFLGLVGFHLKNFSPALYEILDDKILNKKVIVYCESGLCNRLRTLISAYFLSKVLDRKMEFIWVKNSSCGASFFDLFENNEFNIVDNYSIWKKIFFKKLPLFRDKKTEKISFDLLKIDFLNNVIVTFVSVFSEKDFPYHNFFLEESNKIFDILKPKKYIRDEVDFFVKNNFTCKVMGVHIRRGDFTIHFPDKVNNLSFFIKEMDVFIENNPNAKFFVSTDDGAKTPKGLKTNSEDVINILIKRYGSNKILQYKPRSLDRESVESIEDALVNLLILRKTDEFIGNQYSSFSGLVMLNRGVPQKRV